MTKQIHWVCSDPHFCHGKLAVRRGFETPEDMDEALIAEWNKRVGPTDRVICCGDFAFGDDLIRIEAICGRLNGNITLVLGNHDTPKKTREVYAKRFRVLSMLEQDGFLFSHAPVHEICLTKNGKDLTNIHGHMHKEEVDSHRYVNVNYDVLGQLFFGVLMEK